MDAKELRLHAEQDFWFFLQLMNPGYKYSDVHQEFANTLQASFEENVDCLGLLPRGHLKSHILANFAVWLITRDPTESIVYTAYSADFAEKQVFAMKQILASDRYAHLWPENIQGGKKGQRYCRTLWRSHEIMLDNPKLKEMNSREPSVSVGQLNSPKTGYHPTVLMFDDIVVIDRSGNYPSAHKIEGRKQVREVVASLNNTLPASGRRFAVGTRYHPDDQYGRWIEERVKEYAVNTAGEEVAIGEKKVWTVFRREVEEDGVFLWPARKDDLGRIHGFTKQILEGRRVAELDAAGNLEQYWAQYYNRVNSVDLNRLDRSTFQYYERQQLVQVKDGRQPRWAIAVDEDVHYNLSLYAAIDLAYSVATKADYSAIAVIGIDPLGNIYVLDVVRYKTEDFQVHADKLVEQVNRWGFNRVRIEANGPQKANPARLQRLINDMGHHVIFTPFTDQTPKQERLASILEPKYQLHKVFHCKSLPLMTELEDQLEQLKPKHDDLKDALATAIEVARPPARTSTRRRAKTRGYSKYGY